jgi:S-adenosylmethionine hydrolase
MYTTRICLTLAISCLSAALISAHETTWFPAQVLTISEEYPNINTDITEPQLVEHGIVQGTTFRVMFENHTMEAMLGKTYSDVEKGKWIALIEEDGKLQLAISFGNAATDIGCEKGDTVYIESQPKKE